MAINTPDSASGYAFWVSSDGSTKVVYSLALMSEIDILVNDGYRRIPHGGVESRGVLFGTRDGSELRIEAFRTIECRHAFGPSFVLSERDLESLRDQLKSASADEELAGLQPLGWFLGHTRSAFAINDREVTWFDEFFPQPGSVTLLVKPERFQPTRFAFLVRENGSKMERDGTSSAFILPLSGQSASMSQGPAQSIPAPERGTSAPVESSEPPLTDGSEEEPPPLAPPPVVPEPIDGEVTRVRVPTDAPKMAEAATSAVPPPPPGLVTRPVSGASAPPAPGLNYPYARLEPTRPRATIRHSDNFGFRSAAVLVLAALLGCIAGYWAYLQLPSPVIPVSVRDQSGQFVVEWPAAQTETVDYAALQVNDGQWITLSSDEKKSGHAVVSVPTTGDLKIDLLAKHWLRDSRGIVRYIRTPR